MIFKSHFLIFLLLGKINQFIIANNDDNWRNELTNTFSEICKSRIFSSHELNNNFSLLNNSGQEFLGNYEIEIYLSTIFWKFYQRSEVSTSPRTYIFTLSDMKTRDLRLTQELFNVPFMIDIFPQATPLLQVCGHNNDTIGVFYGTSNYSEYETCYNFSLHSKLHPQLQLNTIRIYQPWAQRLKIYEIYKDHLVESHINNLEIKFLTKLVMGLLPCENKQEGPINPVNVLLKQCNNRPEPNNLLEYKGYIFGTRAYRYIQDLCQSINQPGIYNIASRSPETKLYNNVPLAFQEDENNNTVIKIQYLAEFGLKFKDGQESFSLFEKYGTWLSSNLADWDQTLTLGLSTLVTMEMEHRALNDNVCFVEFINLKDQTRYVESIQKNSKISVNQDPRGANFTISSIVYRSIVVDLPDYFLVSGSCDRAEPFEKLFNFGTGAYMSIGKTLQSCDGPIN